MRYRKLGSSDLEVSEIALGAWLTYAGGVEFEQTRACTDAAFEVGINFFDTANVYGRGAAETAWGEILSKRPRDSYILATKVWGQMSDDPDDRGLSAARFIERVKDVPHLRALPLLALGDPVAHADGTVALPLRRRPLRDAVDRALKR